MIGVGVRMYIYICMYVCMYVYKNFFGIALYRGRFSFINVLSACTLKETAELSGKESVTEAISD